MRFHKDLSIAVWLIAVAMAPPAAWADTQEDRIARLEAQLAAMQAELAALKTQAAQPAAAPTAPLC